MSKLNNMTDTNKGGLILESAKLLYWAISSQREYAQNSHLAYLLEMVVK